MHISHIFVNTSMMRILYNPSAPSKTFQDGWLRGAITRSLDFLRHIT